VNEQRPFSEMPERWGRPRPARSPPSLASLRWRLLLRRRRRRQWTRTPRHAFGWV